MIDQPKKLEKKKEKKEEVADVQQMHSHEYDPLLNRCLVFHIVSLKIILILQVFNFFNVLIYEMIWIESNTYGILKSTHKSTHKTL